MLRDAGDHVTSLPKAEQDLNVADVDREPHGGAADGRDFVMHSRIAVLHALNRNVKRLFNSGHKVSLGKAQKIKTVQGNIRELGMNPKGNYTRLRRD